MLTIAIASLFLLPRSEGRLPSCGLLAWRRGNYLDLLFLWFLGLPITSLRAFGHAALLRFDDEQRLDADFTLTRSTPHFFIALSI
jgi:hypothetical protein